MSETIRGITWRVGGWKDRFAIWGERPRDLPPVLNRHGDWVVSFSVREELDTFPTEAAAREFAAKFADQPEPAAAGGVELPTGPGVWRRKADSRDAYEIIVRRLRDEDGNLISGPMLCSGWCGPDSVLCSTANLPRGNWHPAPSPEVAEVDTTGRCQIHNRYWSRLPSVQASHCPECLVVERDEAMAEAKAEALRLVREAVKRLADAVGE